MQPGALRALEFDRIVTVVTGLALTPTGRDQLAGLQPMTEAARVLAAQRATTEGVRFLADHQGFPLRAPADFEEVLEALGIEGRALEALRLFGLSEFLESVEQSRSAILKLSGFPILNGLVAGVASFRDEIADVRRKIDPSGEVKDSASPALASIRDRLRGQKAKLRKTLDAYVRGRDTAKYLQEQVVTDRNGRYVLMVRAEHRGSIPGVVHGASSSGASLFLEPLETVDINNDIVALEEQEAEEVRRILLALTDAFRGRPDDLRHAIEVATELDVVQAKARFAQMTGSIEAAPAADGAFELRGARHPLLMRRVAERLDEWDGESPSHVSDPVPVDILLIPPARVLVVTGPNTGGKTVALKTAGLFALMAQAGLHLPVEHGSRLPVFRSLFADIGDEQSIAASLSTFSAHITNVVSMDRSLVLPALVLLDEVGAGTDPAEGGALGTAVIDHFRQRGAHLIATTHYDSLKSYASTTAEVVSAAFGFNPETFAPTYRLVYGSPGRSLAIEIAARLGMPSSVIAAARENLSEREQQLADHLARMDQDLAQLEQERRQLARERAAAAETTRAVRSREEALRDREDALRRRLDAKIDEQLRGARREIDAVVENLKARAAELSEQAAVRLRSGGTVRAAGISTGETGATRTEARAALDAIAERLRAGGPEGLPLQGSDGGEGSDSGMRRGGPAGPPAPVEIGARVTVGGLGLEGTVVEIRGKQAEVDVRGKRVRAAVRDLTVIAGSASRNPAYVASRNPADVASRNPDYVASRNPDYVASRDPAYVPGSGGKDETVRRAGSAERGPAVTVNVNLQPREGLLSELNVIGCTVDEALTRVSKFLDESTVTDQQELRIIHGHGTGQLRRAIAELLKEHPLVASFHLAPQNQGGGGATIVELKD